MVLLKPGLIKEKVYYQEFCHLFSVGSSQGLDSAMTLQREAEEGSIHCLRELTQEVLTVQDGVS